MSSINFTENKDSKSIKKLPISVFIVCKNEEKHIEKTLKSIETFDEIILIDSGSTDKTLEIAKNYHTKIFYRDWEGYAKQKQYAMSLCTHDWVLNLDGDEEVPFELLPIIENVITKSDVDSVRFLRNDIFMGTSLSKLSKKPNNNRLYKKNKSHFDDTKLVHESALVKGKEVFIKEVFNHYGYGDIDTITRKNNIYSSLKAKEKFIKMKNYSNLKLFLIFPLEFLKQYFLQRKIFSGRKGFILAILDSYYAFLKEAKLYEFHKSSENVLSNTLLGKTQD